MLWLYSCMVICTNAQWNTVYGGDGKWEWFEAQSTYVGQLTDLPFRIIGICMSTQKYKDTENKLNEALQKAQRSDELKSVFLANMSHEIRTPLNAIVGFSTLLACGDADLSRQEIMEFTSLIEKNSQLLMVLISDILDLSKIESNTMEFHFEKVSLNGILESIYSAQKMNLRKGVELLLDASGPGGSYLYRSYAFGASCQQSYQ